MTVEQAYEAILAGKRENIDITRYTKTEQDNYQNTVVNPNNIKVYDSYYNAAIGEEGQGNIYIDNITNYDAVALNAQTYVGSYADSNAGEQLTGYDSNGDNGVIKADRYNGLSTNTIRHLPYSVKYSYSTPNPQVGQKMTVTIAVTNKDQGYGLAAQNNYVAPIAIQNLRLKSRFAGNGPITLKSTNGIRMNQNGTEFYIDTIPVGGTVNIVFEYTVQDIDDLNALVRTIEQNNEMYLVNNNYNDYYIADKTFSGGIYRTTLRAQVKSESTTYGFGFKGKLPYADDVYYWNKGSDSWLTMEGLVEDHKTAAQDDEKLDLKAKNTNQYKSEFVYKLVPSETTDAGSYPVKYIGLNEFNYDLLKNYVVTEDPGSIEVRPRKIMVSVDESQKIYGTTNPFFNSTFKVLGTDAQGNELDMTDENNWTVLGDDSTVDYNNMKLIGGDTVGNVVEVINGAARSPLAFTNGVSNLPYLTTATQNSDVIYQTDVPAEDCAYCLEKYNEMHKGHEHYHDDDHPHSHVPVNGYPVSVNENAGYGSTLGIKTVTNSEGQTVSNYELVYESNVLKIHPRLIRIAAIDATKAYGGTEPALKWVVDGEIIKPTSEMLGIKAVRDSGENVRDAGYTITLTYTGDADKKTIVNGDDLKAVISITKKDVENAKAEEISMKSADGAASLVAESVPESVKDYGAYDMVGSYDNDDYLITIVNGVYTIGERLVEVTVTEPKDIVYGDTTNPDFTVNAVATNGDGTHGAAVKPDSLGLKMALVYTPFENDKTTDNAQTAPLTADAKATLTPDIASGDDGVESDSQFKTENVKNAGTYTYTVSSDYDAAVEQNYAVTIKVVDADKNEADGQFVIARKDLTVTLDPNPSTKLYGTKTVIPEVKTSGYAFDESVETVKLPAFELIVASSVDGIFFNNTKDLLDTIISVKLVDVKPMEVAENAIAG